MQTLENNQIEPPSQSIDYHLSAALSHLEAALDQSIINVQKSEAAKKMIGAKWESFLANFFGSVREKGIKSKLNLLSFISFSPRIR
jgi:hypothetical protein